MIDAINDLLSSINNLLDDIKATQRQIATTVQYNPTPFEQLCDGIMNSGKTERSRWERIKIANFRQYLDDKNLLLDLQYVPGLCSEIYGKVWLSSAEYDFTFVKCLGNEIHFYHTYDKHLAIEIRISVDHPTAKILLLK